MSHLGLIIILIGFTILILSELALMSVKKMINKEIAEDIKKLENDEPFENEVYKNDVNEFSILMKTASFVLRFIYVGLIVLGIVLLTL